MSKRFYKYSIKKINQPKQQYIKIACDLSFHLDVFQLVIEGDETRCFQIQPFKGVLPNHHYLKNLANTMLAFFLAVWEFLSINLLNKDRQ